MHTAHCTLHYAQYAGVPRQKILFWLEQPILPVRQNCHNFWTTIVIYKSFSIFKVQREGFQSPPPHSLSTFAKFTIFTLWWLKVTQSVSKWLKETPGDSKWLPMTQSDSNYSKWLKVTQSDSKWLTVTLSHQYERAECWPYAEFFLHKILHFLRKLCLLYRVFR